MKPFDLQKAIEGHPLVTRDGRKVTEFHYFKTAQKGNCIAVINGRYITCSKDGYYLYDNHECNDDLLLASETKWVNLYWDSKNRRIIGPMYYDTEKMALQNIDIISNNDHTYLQTIEIEIP